MHPQQPWMMSIPRRADSSRCRTAHALAAGPGRGPGTPAWSGCRSAALDRFGADRRRRSDSAARSASARVRSGRGTRARSLINHQSPPGSRRPVAIWRPAGRMQPALRVHCVWSGAFGCGMLKGERGSLAETSGGARELFPAAARFNEEHLTTVMIRRGKGNTPAPTIGRLDRTRAAYAAAHHLRENERSRDYPRLRSCYLRNVCLKGLQYHPGRVTDREREGNGGWQRCSIRIVCGPAHPLVRPWRRRRTCDRSGRCCTATTARSNRSIQRAMPPICSLLPMGNPIRCGSGTICRPDRLLTLRRSNSGSPIALRPAIRFSTRFGTSAPDALPVWPAI